MHDAIVIGGGFAGVTAARELAASGFDVLLVEARDRLGGRTWRTEWEGHEVELGGGYVHWHQPHVFAELTRAGLGVRRIPESDLVAWRVGSAIRRGSMAERDAIAARGWDAYMRGAPDILPQPHQPLANRAAVLRVDTESAAQRIAALGLPPEDEAVLAAEVESVTSAPLDEAGALAALRWHALSGYSLDLTQDAGGGFMFAAGTRSLLDAIAGQVPFQQRLQAPVAAVRRAPDGVTVRLRSGEELAARGCVVALPLNCLGDLAFEPALPDAKQAAIALGQASRGSKAFIHVRGERRTMNAIVPGHSLGYVSTDRVLDDGSQLLVTFGIDSTTLDVANLRLVQTALDYALPGYEVLAARMHDWTADEFSKGTWAAHRPGWYGGHHEAMRAPEGRLVFGGSDIANGWAGFIDGAIESGLTAARLVRDALVVDGGAGAASDASTAGAARTA
jgi:monoamine oxidase